MDTVQHVILDHTLQRIGDPLFADYICHAYCHEGFCTFVRHGQSFRFEAGDCMIIARRGVIIIPKSTHKERMAQNLDLFDFELTAAEMEQIATLDLRKSLFFDHTMPRPPKCSWAGDSGKPLFHSVAAASVGMPATHFFVAQG